MKPIVQDLALALLTRVKERGGTANKTKLLKLLYLADIEHFRKHGETLTGFDWIFYLYGPWSAEYDGLLEELELKDLIRVDQWSKGDIAGARLETNEPRDLNKLIQSADEYYRIQHQVDTWADKALPDLLNYVYFSTDPMRDAVSLQRLNFEQVDRTPPPIYKRSPSGTPPEALKRIRAKLLDARARNEKAQTTASVGYSPPAYDETYRQALDALASSEEF
jgi:uncharacterized protein YwgA